MYLMDVVAFLKYILNMSPASVRLGTKWINALLVELRARLRDIGRHVVGYQLKVRQSKSDKLVDARRHKLFIEVAPENIAAALDDLEKQPENRAMLKLFFGFLSGYIIAITGHRKGVVINMTTEGVETAEKAKDGARIIRVEHHKTQRYFGQAAIPLKANEYAWFERYNQLREYVKGGSEASTFFHNSTGGVLLKLDQYFKEAWEGIYLGTAPTFSMLRYSLATYAKRQLGHKTYRKVATFMCHDKHTAKKFYQADDPAEEVLRSRYLSVLAISTYAAKKRSKECKKAYVHNDNMETVSSSEEEVELEPSGPEKPKVSLSAEDGAGDRKTTVNVTQPDSEEEMEQVPRKTYQLHKRNKIVRSKQQRPINLSKHMVSSSEDDGTDDWEPTQDSSADDSEMEEGPILQRQKCMVTSREADGKPTQGYSENGSEWEEKQERQMVKKEAKKKLVASPVLQKEQAYISPGKASILKIHSSKTVFDGTSKDTWVKQDKEEKQRFSMRLWRRGVKVKKEKQSLYWGHGEPVPISGVTGHQGRIHPGRSANPSQGTHTHGNLEMPINLQCMSLDRGRELEHLEETPEARGEHANSTTHTVETGIEPLTLEV
ncbi:hypothetical protein QTP70_015746 [Hemibagrus guttatus]|uniref:Uncharacterized protein n=1 Tax=Hemibagrus guttatus TaxID=175788 RepID=A0AAE0UHN1_9TELE|nr:hypothetical protein QTP70_015746 [Hemibagrus guttatus]